MLTKADVVERYLPSLLTASSEPVTCFAPSNIALCKYWGKREKELNLPVNSSLSISLGHLGTQTTLSLADVDQVWLNGERLTDDTPFARKVIAFIDLFRRDQAVTLKVDTRNNIPTAAGLASSASGFAALSLAINQFFALDLSDDVLSAFARMGSGSASRSLFQGFVEWERGQQEDGMDSFARPLAARWDTLRIGLVKVATGEKKVDSRSGMTRTLETASLYQAWPAQAARDISRLHSAISDKDFQLLGETAEHNALSMHATMIASWPPLIYWQPDSLAAMQKVWQLREQGIPIYFTMDAGPNLKLLFEAEHEADVLTAFGEIEVVNPFSAAP